MFDCKCGRRYWYHPTAMGTSAVFLRTLDLSEILTCDDCRESLREQWIIQNETRTTTAMDKSQLQ